MQQWTRGSPWWLLLALLTLPATGCSGLPHSEPTAARPSTGAHAPVVTADPILWNDTERYQLYEKVRSSTQGIPYVSTWDYDEVRGKVVIGIGTLEAMRAVEQAVSALDLPEGFLEIRHPERMLSEAAPFEGCQTEPAPPDGASGGLLIPKVMRPEQTFELSLQVNAPADQIMRGIDSYLECWDGKEWSPRYIFLIGLNDHQAPAGARIYGDNVVLTIGLSGFGPERLTLPTAMPDGWYRLRKEIRAGSEQRTLTALFEVH